MKRRTILGLGAAWIAGAAAGTILERAPGMAGSSLEKKAAAATPTIQPKQAVAPTSVPTPATKQRPYIVPITGQEEANFLERVVYGEAAFYDPANRIPEGRTAEEYNAAYLWSVESIVNIMDNRRESPEFAPDPKNKTFFYILTRPNQFSTLWVPANKDIYFKKNAPSLSALAELPFSELMKYVNTTPLTERELAGYVGNDTQALNNTKTKLALVNRGTSNYLTGIVTYRDRWVRDVLYYKNKAGTDEEWDSHWLGRHKLAWVGEDANGLLPSDRHQFYKVVERR